MATGCLTPLTEPELIFCQLLSYFFRCHYFEQQCTLGGCRGERRRLIDYYCMCVSSLSLNINSTSHHTTPQIQSSPLTPPAPHPPGPPSLTPSFATWWPAEPRTRGPRRTLRRYVPPPSGWTWRLWSTCYGRSGCLVQWSVWYKIYYILSVIFVINIMLYFKILTSVCNYIFC